MGYKCAPQLIGLVRGEPQVKVGKDGKKHRQKHRANGGAILNEFGEERQSKSNTLDRTRSELNRYEGYSSGAACWDDMVAEAEAYRVPVTLRDGTAATRGLPHNAVVGWSMIFNPPAAMTEGWDDEDYQAFYDDSFAAMCEIEPRLFRVENIRMDGEHFDEGIKGADGEFGRHLHRAGVPVDASGKYCGNLVDALLLSRINQEYPRLMRARGWQLDDLDVTDWEKAKTDAAYREERKAKRKGRGRDVNKFVVDKAAAVVDELTSMRDELSGDVVELTRKAGKARQEATVAEVRAEDANAKAEAAERRLEALQAEEAQRRENIRQWDERACMARLREIQEEREAEEREKVLQKLDAPTKRTPAAPAKAAAPAPAMTATLADVGTMFRRVGYPLELSSNPKVTDAQREGARDMVLRMEKLRNPPAATPYWDRMLSAVRDIDRAASGPAPVDGPTL